MWRFLCEIMVLVALCVSFGACSKPETVVAQEENVIESEYLKILGELTQIMRAGTEPEKTLDNLRLYVESDKANVSKAVHELRKSILAMDDGTRADWRKKAIPRLNAALDDFAYAQLHLQKKLNDEQKWELGEILSLLKP